MLVSLLPLFNKLCVVYKAFVWDTVHFRKVLVRCSQMLNGVEPLVMACNAAQKCPAGALETL